MSIATSTITTETLTNRTCLEELRAREAEANNQALARSLTGDAALDDAWRIERYYRQTRIELFDELIFLERAK